MILASGVQKFAFQFNENEKKNPTGKNQTPLQAASLNAFGLLGNILHYMLDLYCKNENPDFLSKAYTFVDNEFKNLKNQNCESLDFLLEKFCEDFPPLPVFENKQTAKEWLNSIDESSNTPNKYLALEELALLKLNCRNPAGKDFSTLFDDKKLKKIRAYNFFWEALSKCSKKNASPILLAGTNLNKLDILSLLEEPIKFSPNSLLEQLEYIKIYWGKLIPDIIAKILFAKDLIKEEQKAGWALPAGGLNQPVYSFENLQKEYERFTPDQNWMPNVVLIAKSTLVWLDQLSKKYQRHIKTLDQIPNEELEFFARAGINGLWLIGIWERSKASQRIKQICGNSDAAASAYSLYDYEIAEELGGWQSLADLRTRAWQYGIRLAADMVPNHTGLDSKWVMEKPHLFLQCKQSPFPSYSFDGENLSQDNRTSVFLENGYYRKDDCAVVFKRRDNSTGDEVFIYHGNDGTGLPWNDTAQIDFLNAEAREEVIQKILHVARNFPIIRFDAAMVLAKKHIRRLWYPEPGKAGDIASRANYSISLDEFEKRIPEEFWREVVDRCAKEIPDTLLLAEAFWMMEGYFVRTLGMHRVYNSAFMNMLKKEENAKYRQTIKNTLGFDPEVLKRFVNFMNNPDEETAIAQFGDGDKYFGVCTMMSAMPGLPMFGHGQLEGFEEKYGMEFKKAGRDEPIKDWLVDRHRREIFPLLHKRYVFSEVKNFRLFDFWNNNQVNENVFAWSNYFGNERALIFYNNAYEQAAGWVKTSAAFAVKNEHGEKHLEQNDLIYALNLKNDDKYFTIMQEQKSKLYFLRKNTDLAKNGCFATLNGYETQVFLNIEEVEDRDGSYLRLFEKLNGSGVQNIEREIKKIKYEEIYSAIENFVLFFLESYTKNHQEENAIKPKSEIKDLFADIIKKLEEFGIEKNIELMNTKIFDELELDILLAEILSKKNIG